MSNECGNFIGWHWIKQLLDNLLSSSIAFFLLFQREKKLFSTGMKNGVIEKNMIPVFDEQTSTSMLDYFLDFLVSPGLALRPMYNPSFKLENNFRRRNIHEIVKLHSVSVVYLSSIDICHCPMLQQCCHRRSVGICDRIFINILFFSPSHSIASYSTTTCVWLLNRNEKICSCTRSTSFIDSAKN